MDNREDLTAHQGATLSWQNWGETPGQQVSGGGNRRKPLERFPYKEDVGGSSPSAPTT